MGTAKIAFVWKPGNDPVKDTSHRVPIALELGGDDPSLGTATRGRIKITEVSGNRKKLGPGEATKPRLLATFHGTFHRDASRSTKDRVTFELEGSGSSLPHDFQVVGFDPECMISVDAFIVTFLNREFPISLPFFVDAREGDFLEFQVTAERESAGAFISLPIKAAVLSLRIRRTRLVQTTTIGSSYEASVLGNVVLEQEHYLLTANDPSPPHTGRLIPVSSGRTKFARYNPGDMKIVVVDDLITKICPPEAFVKKKFPKEKPSTLHKEVADALKKTTEGLMHDAGFSGAELLFESDSAGSAITAKFNADHKLPFFQYVAIDRVIAHLGEGEGFESIPGKFSITEVGKKKARKVLLPFPTPIGSGEKSLTSPILINGSSLRGTYSASDRKALSKELELRALRTAAVLAHEVAHSLGIFHPALIGSGTPYREETAKPVLAIMASATDAEEPYASDLLFSNQNKLIWKGVFGTTPTLNDAVLHNKTWKAADVLTTPWPKRRTVFNKRHHVGSGKFAVAAWNLLKTPPPFAGTGKKVQKGTFVP